MLHRDRSGDNAAGSRAMYRYTGSARRNGVVPPFPGLTADRSQRSRQVASVDSQFLRCGARA